MLTWLLLTTIFMLLWALIGICIDRMFQEGLNRPWSHWRYILSGPLLAGPLWQLYVLTVIEDLEAAESADEGDGQKERIP